MGKIAMSIREHETIMSYVLMLVISVEVLFIFLGLGFLQNIPPEDTRYFLSALAQVEGAIIAIYITMMLVGVQLTIKDYSEVVNEVYLGNPEFWLVFISYITSIVFTLILLQNVGNLNTSWLCLIYLWGTFNLLIVPLFIRDSFLLFNPRRLIDKFIHMHKITEERMLPKLFRIASKSIQSQNVEVATYILQKIWEYARIEFSKKLNTLAKRAEKRRGHDLNELKLMLAFIEELTFRLRYLALYTIDQFNAGRITQDEATWILNMIEPIFRIIFADLVISLYPLYFVPEIKENLEHALSQCLLELELIIEKLQEAPSEIKMEELRKFLNVLPYNFISSLERAGCEHLAERVKRLQELAKDDEKYDDFIEI